MSRRRFTGMVVLALTLTVDLSAQESLYTQHIRPTFKQRCFPCHGALKQEAGLRLDTGTFARRGGDSGPVINTDQPDMSVVLERILAADPSVRMPPEGEALAEDQIRNLRTWIANGAESPNNEQPEPAPTDHWAFQKPVRPQITADPEDRWSRNDIDRLICRQHQSRKLQPAPDASAAHLLRRVTLDLTGLPPSINDINDFVANPSQQNYDAIVDKLLASPQYGERWARHWMDVWRYSDWYGRRQQNDVRNSAPQIWRWRDWIVSSLNDNKSYARMIQEMLAADEIAPEDDRTWPATGYLVRNYYSLNPNEWMRHNVEYTGKAFLGLTFNCAHCHDHKYDPITHVDYFRLRAFFEPIGVRQDRVAGEPEPPPFQPYTYAGSRKVVKNGMVRIFDESPAAETWFYTGGDERNRQTDKGSIAPGVPAFLNVPLPEIRPIKLPMSGWYPGARPNIQAALIEEASDHVDSAVAALQLARSEDVDRTSLVEAVQTATAAFDAALTKAIASGEQGALQGKQSLLFDSTNGRRLLQHELPDIRALPDGTTISFDMAILKEGHFNFQLARDSSKGLTALYVGFENGKIMAYRPSSFTEFVVGRYPTDGAARPLRITLTLHPKSDTALLNVIQTSTPATDVLVDDAVIALNEWNPSAHRNQPFTFDCRPGTRVLVDSISIHAAPQSWMWSFEPPDYEDGRDVASIDGWRSHPLSSGSASSVVSSVAGCTSAASAHGDLQQARAALTASSSHIKVAELRLTAAQKQAVSLAATINADNAERDGNEQKIVTSLRQTARAAQLDADAATALWKIADTERQIGQRTLQKEPDKQSESAIADLRQALQEAENTLAIAQKEQQAPPDPNEYQRLSPTTNRQSTGRRTTLARWITHPHNPLTPRVAINHIWMRHFHAPLVETVSDFGRNGKAPVLPDVLDWLAVELVENNWRMKHIHKLIVTSRTYQMSSSVAGLQSSFAIDEDNKLLWRMNTGRMEAEVVRDSVLAIDGTLDRTIGGEVLPNTTALNTFRRSIYYEVFPEDGGNNAVAEIFDAPNPSECFRRTTTIVPQQALALSNSQLIHRSAAKISEELRGADGTTVQAIETAFLKVLSRSPTQQELTTCQNYLSESALADQNDSERGALEGLVRALFNHNDFVTIR